MESVITKLVTHHQNELREYVQECTATARKIIAPYWPISTFVANNSLANLENLPFSDAMKYAQELRGSQGFLPLSSYRKFYKDGRITENNLEEAIENGLEGMNHPQIILAGKQIAHRWLYKFWMLDDNNPQELKQKQRLLWESIYKRLALSNLLETPDKVAISHHFTVADKTFARDGQTITHVINKRMITWCAAFLDEGQAAWAMPNREQGFYKCWKSLADYDTAFRYFISKPVGKRIKALSDDASEALGMLLQELGVPKAAWTDYLTRHLSQLPGWASAIQWREQHPEILEQSEHPINLIEYLAVRVFYEVVLIEEGSFKPKHHSWLWRTVTGQQNSISEEAAIAASADGTNSENIASIVSLVLSLGLTADDIERLPQEMLVRLMVLAQSCNCEKQQSIWQEAYETNYRKSLMAKLSENRWMKVNHEKPAVQAIFCIDVRSEGFRRHLENVGPYETFGFAGFFGIPMLYQPFGAACNLTVAPALVVPTQVVREVPEDLDDPAIERKLVSNQRRYTWRSLYHSLRESLLTPFAFVEMVGWFSLVPLVGKTLSPTGYRKVQKAIDQKRSPVVAVKPSIFDEGSEITLEQQAAAVAGMLKAISLTKNFAPIVLLCGHGSETENTPYASALDCGACGGNHGGNSSYVAAYVLNNKKVRQLLAQQGIFIPDETFFLAGEHNTTTDTLTFSNEAQVPASHQAIFEQFKLDAAMTGERNGYDRLNKLPDNGSGKSSTLEKLQHRAADWAQIRPEWGLIRNAAFICGPRSLTAGLDLEARSFLHSYNEHEDADGTVLEGIMTAPVVVAEMINMQYYLSSVDNHVFGSNTKLLHSVVGEVGVMLGRQSDLQIGLPKQSVMVGDELYHEPLRLCVIIQAPRARISAIVGKHERLQFLTRNKWITLISYDAAANMFYQYSTNGEWVEIELDDVKEIAA